MVLELSLAVAVDVGVASACSSYYSSSVAARVCACTYPADDWSSQQVAEDPKIKRSDFCLRWKIKRRSTCKCAACWGFTPSCSTWARTWPNVTFAAPQHSLWTIISNYYEFMINWLICLSAYRTWVFDQCCWDHDLSRHGASPSPSICSQSQHWVLRRNLFDPWKSNWRVLLIVRFFFFFFFWPRINNFKLPFTNTSRSSIFSTCQRNSFAPPMVKRSFQPGLCLSISIRIRTATSAARSNRSSTSSWVNRGFDQPDEHKQCQNSSIILPLRQIILPMR